MDINALKTELLKPEYQGKTREQIKALFKAVASETQIVEVSKVTLYINNCPRMRKAIFLLSQSGDVAHRELFYNIELALKLTHVDLKNAEFQKINALTTLGVTQDDINGFFALAPVAQKRVEETIFGDGTDIQDADFDAVDLLPKVAICLEQEAFHEAKYNTYQDARRLLQQGQDVDLDAIAS